MFWTRSIFNFWCLWNFFKNRLATRGGILVTTFSSLMTVLEPPTIKKTGFPVMKFKVTFSDRTWDFLQSDIPTTSSGCKIAHITGWGYDATNFANISEKSNHQDGRHWWKRWTWLVIHNFCRCCAKIDWRLIFFLPRYIAIQLCHCYRKKILCLLFETVSSAGEYAHIGSCLMPENILRTTLL